MDIGDRSPLSVVNSVLKSVQTHNPAGIAMRTTLRGKLVPAQKTLQIGARGGLYYTTANGTVVYLKDKDKRVCAAKKRLTSEVQSLCASLELRNDDIPQAIKAQYPHGRYIRKYGAFKRASIAAPL